MSQVTLDHHDANEVAAVMDRAHELCDVLEVELERQLDGRPRHWTAHGILAALILLARHEIAFHIDRASDLIATLDTDTRERLQLNRPDGRPYTTRQISYAWNRITRCVDPADPKVTSETERIRRLELLMWVQNELLWATADKEFRSQWHGDLAVDATLVWAHGRPPGHPNVKLYASGSDGDGIRTTKRVDLIGDDVERVYDAPTSDHPFLGDLRPVPHAPEERCSNGRRRRRDRGNHSVGAKWIGSSSFSKVLYGFAHHIAVAVGPGAGPSELPPVAIGQITSPPTSHPARSVMPLMEDIHRRRSNDPDRADDDPILGDILADGGYSQAKAENWALPVRALGAEPIFHLHTQNQAGHRGSLEGHPGGYLFIDGCYFCPCLPEELRTGIYPRFGKYRDKDHKQMRAEFRSILVRRKPYKLQPRGRYGDKGLRFATPHPDGTCESCGTNSGCCGTKYVNIAWDQLGTYQKHEFGSEKWAASYDRRSRVEGYFGALKCPTVGRHNRNTALFFEYAKTALAATFAAVATNLHLLANWHANRVSGKKKRHRPGRPRLNPTLRDIAHDPGRLDEAREKKRQKRRRRPAREKPPPDNPFADLGAPAS